MSRRTRLSLDLRELLFAFDDLVRTMPDRDHIRKSTLENHDWVGRARVLVADWDESRETLFNQSCDVLFARSLHARSDQLAAVSALAQMMNTIQEARNELRLITGGRVSHAFDAGQPFDFYDELRKAIETAQREIFFVDRYMGADFVSQYLPHVRKGVATRLLTRDLLAPLMASANAFVQQNGTKIEIRTSQSIHGRFLCIDGSRCLLVDASFKDAAKSAPAALIELTDTAASSLAQYESIWSAGTICRSPTS